MKNCVISIPVYKKTLKPEEKNSLIQCISTLRDYDIILFCSPLLDIKVYEQIFEEHDKMFKFENFEDVFFKNINGYNQLLLTRIFYERFKVYEYLLIYQLDAWVFRDDLAFWCNKGYDYIGAPWYEGYHEADKNSPFIGVGNGGFSLRNVKAHLKALNSFSYIISPVKMMLNYKWEHLRHPRNLLEIIYNFTVKNNTFYIFNDFSKNEDTFWGSVCNKNFKWFKVADEDTASQFSLEMKASEFLKKNKVLPFGCHGWFKYDINFWSNHIKF